MTTTPPPVAPPTSPPPEAGARKPCGLAVAAEALGISAFFPCLGLLLGPAGIVLGLVVLAKKLGGRQLAVNGIVIGTFGIALYGALAVRIFAPSFARARELRDRALCRGNLNAIGKGILIYGVENQDAFPPDLEVLVRGEKVSRKILHCPSVARNRRCDYLYLAPSEKPCNVPLDLILACDFKDNHDGEGRNVVYASGEAKWLDKYAFQAELGKSVNAAFAAALEQAEGKRGPRN